MIIKRISTLDVKLPKNALATLEAVDLCFEHFELNDHCVGNDCNECAFRRTNMSAVVVAFNEA